MIKKIYYNNQETNYSVSDDGHIYNDKTGKELKGTYARNEYHSVQLTINGKVKTFMTHRLVAESFLPNPENLPVVDHIDRNKYNNNVSNLRWVSVLENNNNKGRNKTRLKQESKEITDFTNFKELIRFPGYFANEEGILINSSGKEIYGNERNGYLRVNLSCYGHISKHLLIWEAFNGEIPEGMVIDHIDGNRQNNKLSNLRLVTQSENMLNAQVNGHKGQVKISQYDREGNFIAKYNSIREAANTIDGNEIAIKDAANRHGASAGFLWIRDDQNITIDELLKITRSGKPKVSYIGVNKYDKEGNLIEHFDSLTKAAESVNASSSTIRRTAEAKRIGKDYYWILDNQDISINDLIK